MSVATLHIGVLGVGGVGGLIAALASRAGADVTCIATENTVERISERGISVESDRFGAFREDVRAESRLSTRIDVLCVAVKATSLGDALDRVPTEVLDDAIIVPFLNGLDHVAVLRERFDSAVIVPATIRVQARRRAAGEIFHGGSLASIELAVDVDGVERVAPFVELLEQVGFDVRVRDDEWPMLWEKLAFLAPLALLTTACDISAGTVRTERREQLIAIIEEISGVAIAEGVPIDPVDVLAYFDTVPPTMTSSMHHDAESGRSLEIEAIGGVILRAAATHGLTVPETASLVEALRLLDATLPAPT